MLSHIPNPGKIVFLLAILGLSTSFSSIENNQVKQIWSSAHQMLQVGDTAGAYQAYQSCLNYQSCPNRVFYQLAMINKYFYGDENSYWDQLTLYGERSKNPKILLEVAQHVQQENSPEALSIWRKLTQFSQTKKRAHQYLTQYFLKMGDRDSIRFHQEAQKSFDRAPAGVVSGIWMDLLNKGKWRVLDQLIRDNKVSVPAEVQATIKSLSLYNLGQKKESFQYAYTGFWSSQFPFLMYRVRLEALYSQKNYAKLIEEADPYHSLIEMDAKCLGWLASSHLKSGDKQTAQHLFEKSWALKNQIFDFSSEWATLFIEKKKAEKAKVLLLQQPKPFSYETHHILSNIYAQQDSLDLAIHFSMRALGIKKSLEGYIHHGLLCVRASRLPEAEKSFLKALKADPENVEVLTHLESVYDYSGKWKKQSKIIHRLSNLSPQEPTLWLKYARLFTNHSEWNKAQPWLEKCFEANHAPEIVVHSLARVYKEQGKVSKAKNLLERFLKRNPNHRHALMMYNDLGLAYLSKEEKSNALLALLKIEPSNIGFYREYYGLMKNSPGKNEQYYQVLANFYSVAPSNGDVLKELIEWNKQTGNSQQTAKYLEDWIRTQDDVSSLNLLLALKSSESINQETLHLARRVYNQIPHDSTAKRVYELELLIHDSTQAFNFLSAYVGRIPYSSWALCVLSKHLEVDHGSKALLLARKGWEADHQNKQAGYQFSKLMIKRAVRVGKSVPKKLPYQKFSYSPDSLHFIKGIESLAQDEFDIATRFLNQKNKEFENELQPYVWLLHSRKGEWKKIITLSESQNLQQLDSLSWETLAMAYHKQNLSNQFLKKFENDNLYIQSYPVCQMVAGFAYFKAGQFEESEILLTGLHLPEWEKEILWNRVKILYHQENYNELIALLNKTEDKLDHLDSMYYVYGEALRFTVSLQASVKVWERGVTQHEKSVVLLSPLAKWSCENNNRTACIRYSEALQQHSPGELYSAKWLAKIYLKENSLQKAKAVLHRAANKNDGEVDLMLAETYFQLQNYPKTIIWGQMAVQNDKKSPRSHYLLAKAYEKNGEFEKSHNHFYKYSRLKEKEQRNFFN